MKADFIQHGCFVLRLRGLRRLPLVLATVGLASIMTTGCQFDHGHQAAVEPHYGRLEQACFGYEPTVWRTMASDCAQAVRMIPNEVIQLPPAAPAPTPAPAPADAPAPAAPAPALLPLESVPEPGQDSPELPGLLRDIEPSAEPPAQAVPPAEPPAQAVPPAGEVNPPAEADAPAEDNPAVPPAEMAPPQATEPTPQPPTPAPAPAAPAPLEPALPDALPKTDIVPPAEPADAPAPAASGPPLSHRSGGTRVIPVAQLRTSRANPTAARALFESLEQALDATEDADAQNKDTAALKPARPSSPDKPGTVGLARFISY